MKSLALPHSAATAIRQHSARVVAGAALAVVALVTGRISYSHIEALSLALHQPLMVARLMPFGVDGLIIVGSVVLLQSARGQEWLGWLGVAPGVAASLFANVESGIRFGWLAATWAGVPAASFALACFLFERWLYAQARRVAQGGPAERLEDTQSREPSGQCPHGVAASLDEAVMSAWLHGRDCLGEPPSQRQLSASFGVSRQKVAGLVGDNAAA